MKSKSKSDTNPSSNTDLHHLFVDQLRDILWAEKALVRALPKMAKNAKDQKLKEAITQHLEETKGQIERLGQVFSILGLTPRAKKCQAMAGLLEEADELAEEYTDSTALDAALIAAAQKVEHYEIATYGTLRTFAEVLGRSDLAELLTATLEEESAADELLTSIATSQVNEEAAV